MDRYNPPRHTPHLNTGGDPRHPPSTGPRRYQVQPGGQRRRRRLAAVIRYRYAHARVAAFSLDGKASP
jgi:hypothetical protein